MLFDLKNLEATYQRAMIALFHDMLLRCLEDYIDNIVLKSKEVNQHVDNLRKKLYGAESITLR